MAENKRYYWLRLKDDFFSSKRIKKLRKLGADYLIIYLKMQLKALKTDGYLYITGIEDSIADEIALDIDEDTDKVQLTLSYLQACSLLEIGDDGNILLPYVEALTGSETASAQRVREHRERKKLLQCNTDVTQLQQHCNVEKEIEKEIETDIEKEIEIERPTHVKEPKHKYGEYNHVLLTDSDRERLVNDYGEDSVHAAIKYLDEYIETSGKKYKNHYLVMRKWVFDAIKERKGKAQTLWDEWKDA